MLTFALSLLHLNMQEFDKWLKEQYSLLQVQQEPDVHRNARAAYKLALQSFDGHW